MSSIVTGRLFPLALGWALPALASPSFGEAAASLTGTVVDLAGRPVSGPRVVVVHQPSHASYSAQADDLGLFTFRSLPAGAYLLSVEWSGQAVTRALSLALGQASHLSVTLEVDRRTEAVDVRYQPPLLQADSAVVAHVLGGGSTTSLPLNGRNFAQLALLLPGVVTTAPASLAQPRIEMEGRPYVNGHRQQGNSFILDGVDTNEPLQNTQPYQPSPEAVEEVRFETNNYSARYGNLAGAMIRATLKSGGSRLHGSVFEGSRPSALRANTWELNHTPKGVRSDWSQHSFGATLGGPLLRDRAFFFADYEGFIREEPLRSAATVPSEAWRRGDFSGLVTNTGQPITLLEYPTQTQYKPFPNNQIPPERLSPVARALLAEPEVIPLPNAEGNQYAYRRQRTVHQHQGDLKLTFSATTRDNGWLRLTTRESVDSSRPEWKAAEASDVKTPFRGAALSWNHVFGVGGLNQLEAGYHRVAEQSSRGVDASLGRANVRLGLEPEQEPPGLSRFLISGIGSIGSTGATDDTVERVHSLTDEVSILAGPHQLRIGGAWQRSSIAVRSSSGGLLQGGVLGSYTFNGGICTNQPFGDFLLGCPSSKTKAYWATTQQIQTQLAFFAEDTFRAHPRVTLTAGLRWSYFSPWVEAENQQSNFDPTTGRQLLAGVDGNSRALYDPYYGGFEPRLGLVWTLPARLVFRAGYGIVQSMEGIPLGGRLTKNPPFAADRTKSYARGAPGTFGFEDLEVRQRSVSGRLNAYDPDIKPQQTQQWNLFLEHGLSNSLTVSLGYVGHRARRLLLPVEANQALPGEGPTSIWAYVQKRRPLYSVWPEVTSIVVTTSKGRSRYDGLQLVLRQRPVRGVEAMVSYTWSKAFTNNVHFRATNGVLGRPGAAAFAQDPGDPRADYGPAFFDVRHNVALFGTWELPGLLRGFRLGGVLTAHTGFPVTVVDYGNQSLLGSLGYALRPNRVGRGGVINPSPDRWIDPAAFESVPAGSYGSSGIGILRGPGYLMWNLGLTRTFHLGGRCRLALKLDALNVLNHPNFGLPVRYLGSSDFGRITQTIDLPRQLELGVKLEF